MADGYQSGTASPVPILCIPANVWHKTFDFSLFTLTQMAGGDRIDKDEMMTCSHLTWKSECQNRHGRYVRASVKVLALICSCKESGVFMRFLICFCTVCACLYFVYPIGVSSSINPGFRFILVLPFSVSASFHASETVLWPSMATDRRIWALYRCWQIKT